MALPKDRTVATVERIVMTYEEEWVAIAARLAALKDAAQLRAQQATTQDSWGIGPMLGNESAAIVPPEGQRPSAA
jgi:hypothetical protein